MAIVGNLAEGASSPAKDKSFTSYNRTNAGSPNATLTPLFSGEIVLDTTNHSLWKAMGLTNNTWVALTAF